MTRLDEPDDPLEPPRRWLALPVALGLALTIGGTAALRMPLADLPVEAQTADELLGLADVVRKTTLVGAAMAVVCALFWTGSRVAIPAKILALVAAGVAWGTLLREDPWRPWMSLANALVDAHELTQRSSQRGGPAAALGVVDVAPAQGAGADDANARSAPPATSRLDDPSVTWRFRPDHAPVLEPTRRIVLTAAEAPAAAASGDDEDTEAGPPDDGSADAPVTADDDPNDDASASAEPAAATDDDDALALAADAAPVLGPGERWSAAVAPGLPAGELAEVVLGLRSPVDAGLRLELRTEPPEASREVPLPVAASGRWQTLRIPLPFGVRAGEAGSARLVEVALVNVLDEPAPLGLHDVELVSRAHVRARRHGRDRFDTDDGARPVRWQSEAGQWLVELPAGAGGRLRGSVLARAEAAAAPVSVSLRASGPGGDTELHGSTLFPGARWRDIDVALPPGTTHVELRADGLSVGTRVAWSDLRLVASGPEPRRTLLLICDDLPPDAFDAVEGSPAPWLAGRAADGLTASACVNPSAWSASASVATILTGHYGHALGSGSDAFTLPGGVTTLADVFAAAGRPTLGFGTRADRDAGLGRGLDVLHLVGDGVAARAALSDVVTPLLSARADEDWFAWVHLEAGEASGGGARAPVISALDEALAALHGAAGQPVLVLVGGRPAAPLRPGDERPDRVPWLVSPAPRGRWTWPCETLDVAPTLLELAGLREPLPKRPRLDQGRSLSPLRRGEHAGAHVDRSALAVSADGLGLRLHGPQGVLSMADGVALRVRPAPGLQAPPSPSDTPKRLADVSPHPRGRLLELTRTYLDGQRARLVRLQGPWPRQDEPLDARTLARLEGGADR